MTRPKVIACLVGVFALLPPQGANAYCRTTTVVRPVSSCPESCITDGIPLYWAVSNPVYNFNVRGFPDLDAGWERELIARAFDRWNNIECPTPQGPRWIGLRIRGAPEITSLQVGPREAEPNENVIVFYTGEEWLAEGLDPGAYALTAIWFNKNNGEILGADMHFNGGMGRFVKCPDTGCAFGDVDLENVATHEAGHFIGLAHSDVRGSTMWCSANPDEVEKRTLEADDIEGACAAYPPGKSFGKDKAFEPGLCTLGDPRQPQHLWPLALACLALWRGRRRR